MRFRKTLWFLVLSLSVVALSLAVTSWQSVPSGSNPRGIAVGDVDKDGVADLVVANFGAPSFIGQDMKDAKPGTLQVFTASGSSLALKAETEVAISRGVFGVPFAIVGGEPFWGYSRLNLLEKWIAEGPF